MLLFGNVIGIIGMILVMSAYYLIQSQKVVSTDIKFILLNFVGGISLLISLIIDFNLASFTLECIFVSISTKALVEYVLKKKTSKTV